jgi:hypothetical protein
VPGNATDLAAASILSTALGAALYGAPFKPFYSKVLRDRAKKFSLPVVGIKKFFLDDELASGESGDKTIGEQRIRAVARMAALAAALTALGVSFLTGMVSLVMQLTLGPPIRQDWQIAGWTFVGLEGLALILLVLHVSQGKVLEDPSPAEGRRKVSRLARRLFRPWTPRPYSFSIFLGSVVAIILAVPNWTSVPASHHVRPMYAFEHRRGTERPGSYIASTRRSRGPDPNGGRFGNYADSFARRVAARPPTDYKM